MNINTFQNLPFVQKDFKEPEITNDPGWFKALDGSKIYIRIFIRKHAIGFKSVHKTNKIYWQVDLQGHWFNDKGGKNPSLFKHSETVLEAEWQHKSRTVLQVPSPWCCCSEHQSSVKHWLHFSTEPPRWFPGILEWFRRKQV